jgi:Protein of unknown function (DUF1552)
MRDPMKKMSHRDRMSRRIFLRGVGVSMALPWLESLPVWGSTSATGMTPAGFPKRFAVLFMGNGINGNHWWAKGSGAAMKLSKSLEPLEKKINVINGLFNKPAVGMGIHPGQTGNLLSGVPIQKGAIVKAGITMAAVSEDGVKARRRSLKGSGTSGTEKRGEKGVYF